MNLNNKYTFLGLFSGAGGLDLGFENCGFNHIESNEILSFAVKTLKLNRPKWNVFEGDIREYSPKYKNDIDVLLAGFPCQGFSLGGNRDPKDVRNSLYREVLRIAKFNKPRVIVMENVLNLRTMKHPESGKPFASQIQEELLKIGYKTKFDFFRVSQHGVPQTRRRFIFVAFLGEFPDFYSFPEKEKTTSIKDYIFELGQDDSIILPNHKPTWGFKSHVHKETNIEHNEKIAVPVRFSRTASDGNPIRDFNSPFPAIDTATVWGWARGNVKAVRVEKDRINDKYIRNPKANSKLWRISASELRSFTAREYARLQTFPDTWEFVGQNKREIQMQIGNAVPVNFASKVAKSVLNSLWMLDGHKEISYSANKQIEMFK